MWAVFTTIFRPPGFRASHLELLDRAAPLLAAAFAARLAGRAGAEANRGTPAAGHMVFSQQRRLVAIDRSAEAWLERLPDDRLQPYGVDVPVAVQSVVNQMWAMGDPGGATCHVADRNGVNVTIRAEDARAVTAGGRHVGGERLFSVSIGRTPWGAEHPAIRLLTSRQRQIAGGVADGLSDDAIAARLGTSAATIHEQVQRLHRVMGTNARPALVAALNRD